MRTALHRRHWLINVLINDEQTSYFLKSQIVLQTAPHLTEALVICLEDISICAGWQREDPKERAQTSRGRIYIKVQQP